MRTGILEEEANIYFVVICLRHWFMAQHKLNQQADVSSLSIPNYEQAGFSRAPHQTGLNT